MRTCFSTCRSTTPGTSRELLPELLGKRARCVSRSSPKILSAICARTPDSMWSSRCEIGWPMLVVTGSTERRLRISLMISFFGRPLGVEIDVDLGGMDAFGMLVEFGAAGAAADQLDLRHLHDQPLGDQPDAVAFRQRDAGIEQHVDGERALVEGRQEGARQLGGEGCSRR